MFERCVDDGHAVGLALRACLGLLGLPAAEFIEASFAEEERLVWWPLTRWWARVFVRVLRAQRSVQRSVRRSRVFVLVPKQPASPPFRKADGLEHDRRPTRPHAQAGSMRLHVPQALRWAQAVGLKLAWGW